MYKLQKAEGINSDLACFELKTHSNLALNSKLFAENLTERVSFFFNQIKRYEGSSKEANVIFIHLLETLKALKKSPLQDEVFNNCLLNSWKVIMQLDKKIHAGQIFINFLLDFLVSWEPRSSTLHELILSFINDYSVISLKNPEGRSYFKKISINHVKSLIFLIQPFDYYEKLSQPDHTHNEFLKTVEGNLSKVEKEILKNIVKLNFFLRNKSCTAEELKDIFIHTYALEIAIAKPDIRHLCLFYVEILKISLFIKDKNLIEDFIKEFSSKIFEKVIKNDPSFLNKNLEFTKLTYFDISSNIINNFEAEIENLVLLEKFLNLITQKFIERNLIDPNIPEISEFISHCRAQISQIIRVKEKEIVVLTHNGIGVDSEFFKIYNRTLANIMPYAQAESGSSTNTTENN